MTRASRVLYAEKTLIAVCSHLVLAPSRDANFKMWKDIAKDVLPDLGKCPEAVQPIRNLASELIQAPDAYAEDVALGALRRVLDDYFSLSAGEMYARWKSSAAVVE